MRIPLWLKIGWTLWLGVLIFEETGDLIYGSKFIEIVRASIVVRSKC
jgi:hypothetical protein